MIWGDLTQKEPPIEMRSIFIVEIHIIGLKQLQLVIELW